MTGSDLKLIPTVCLRHYLLLLTLGYPILRTRREKKQQSSSETEELWGSKGNIIFALALTVVLSLAAYHAIDWPLRGSFILYVLAGVGLPLALAQVALDLRGLRRGGWTVQRNSENGSAVDDIRKRRTNIFFWIIAVLGGVFLFGFHVTLPFFVILYAMIHGARWSQALLFASIALGFIVLVFDQLLHVVWPTPLLISFLS